MMMTMMADRNDPDWAHSVASIEFEDIRHEHTPCDALDSGSDSVTSGVERWDSIPDVSLENVECAWTRKERQMLIACSLLSVLLLQCSHE